QREDTTASQLRRALAPLIFWWDFFRRSRRHNKGANRFWICQRRGGIRPPLPESFAYTCGVVVLVVLVAALDASDGSDSPSCRAFLNPRIPSPKPFPNSGIFLGPKISTATIRITSRCIGWKTPSNIVSSVTDTSHFPPALPHYTAVAVETSDNPEPGQ